MTYIHADLAWELANHCRSSLQKHELDIVFVSLGAGDYYPAIVTAIAAANRRGLGIPREMQSRLSRWAELIAEPEQKRRIEDLLSPPCRGRHPSRNRAIRQETRSPHGQ